MTKLEEFLHKLPYGLKLNQFKKMFDVKSEHSCTFSDNDEPQWPIAYGKAVEAIIGEAQEKLDALEVPYPEGEDPEDISDAACLFEDYMRSFVQYSSDTVWVVKEEYKNLDLLDWLLQQSDTNLELLKAYISLELWKKILQ